MIPRECIRLAEVDFPIAVAPKDAAREMSIRHGHPSTLHLWWARRPLASSRAVLLALLLPDPCDETARRPSRNKRGRSCVRYGSRMAANQTYLDIGRNLVRAAHGEAPRVVDPFAGRGSIPQEALRMGLGRGGCRQ
jgi:adenine-specific DNA methylase